MEKTNQIRIPTLHTEDNRNLSQKYSEFLESSGAMDKIFRLFQFYAKFIIPKLKNKSENLLKLAGFLESFGALCGLTRKMLRIGKYFNFFNNISVRLNKKPEERELNDIFKSLAEVSNLIYVLLDHILLVNKLNVIKLDPNFISKVDLASNLAWGKETVFTIISDFVDYSKNNKIIRKCEEDLKKIENKESVEKAGRIKNDQRKKMINMIRCILDVPVIIQALTGEKYISSSQAGFLGVVTSVISIYQKWGK